MTYNDAALWKRRIDVVQRIAHGHTAQEISDDTGNTLSTVNNDISWLFKQYNARDRAHLVHLAHKANIIWPCFRKCRLCDLHTGSTKSSRK